MAIFQCEDRKGKFILFFSDENSTAELISVHRIPELIRCLIFSTITDTRQHAGSDRLRLKNDPGWPRASSLAVKPKQDNCRHCSLLVWPGFLSVFTHRVRAG